MMKRDTVTVMKFGGPMKPGMIAVRVSIGEDSIEIAADLPDFVSALAAEMDEALAALASEVGNPATMMTTAALERRLKEAAAKVLDGEMHKAAERVVARMKAETTKVV